METKKNGLLPPQKPEALVATEALPAATKIYMGLVQWKQTAAIFLYAEWLTALLLIFFIVQCFHDRHDLLLIPLSVALALLGLNRPVQMMALTLIITPFCMGLNGEQRAIVVVVISASDLLLFMALPAALHTLWTRPDLWRLKGMSLPALWFLAAAMVSFLLNLRYMHGAGLIYFSGWMRSAQLILLLPLMFSAYAWSKDWLKKILLNYVIFTFFIACFAIQAYALGMRHGVMIFHMQKNALGIALTLAILIVSAALIRPAGEKKTFTLATVLRKRNRVFLFCLLPVLCVGLMAALSRGADIALLAGLCFICLLRRRVPLFLVILLTSIGLYAGMQRVVPADTARYMKDFTGKNVEIGSRYTVVQTSLIRFKNHILFGDGARTRRDFLPHNLEVTLLAEGGIIGTALFVWVAVVQFRVLLKARQALSDDPLEEWFCTVVIACAVAMLVHGQVDPYWRHGPLLLVWGGTGIVLSLWMRRTAESNETADRLEAAPGFSLLNLKDHLR